MDTNLLVDWQKMSSNGLVYPWWTHPFLDVLEAWDLSSVKWLEFGAGRSTAWLRSQCLWVDSIEANSEWAAQAELDCQNAGYKNGKIYYETLADGIPENKDKYLSLIPNSIVYDVISVDGIFRYEALEWAINHFKKNGKVGVLVADNFNQDFVWISPASEKLMEPYKNTEQIYFQPDHTNHEGRPWNTRYWIIK